MVFNSARLFQDYQTVYLPQEISASVAPLYDFYGIRSIVWVYQGYIGSASKAAAIARYHGASRLQTQKQAQHSTQNHPSQCSALRMRRISSLQIARS